MTLAYLTVGELPSGDWSPDGDATLADLLGPRRSAADMLARCGTDDWDLAAVDRDDEGWRTFYFKRG